MAQRFRIIDGYNLLHSVGYAQERFGPGGLERSRNRLLRFVANRLDPEERRRTTIVFDARAIPVEGLRESKFEEMTVLFNQPGSDADTLIEELILQHSAPRQLEIVSGDRRLQKAIKRRKGFAIESDHFARELHQRESITPGSAADQAHSTHDEGATERQEPLSESETAEWLEIFGSEVELESDVFPTSRPKHSSTGSEAWNRHVEELMNDLNDGTFDSGADSRRDERQDRKS